MPEAPWSLAALLGTAASAVLNPDGSSARICNPAALDATQLRQLLTVAELEKLLGCYPLVSPLVRVVHNGKRLPVEAFTVPSGSEPDAVRYVDSLKLFRCFRDGGSVVVRDLHRYWPSLTRLSWDLTRQLGFAVTVNGYLSPRDAQAFKPHFDYHDIIVIQISGSKEWVEFDTNAELPLDNNNWRRPSESVNPTLPGDNPRPVGSHVLHPGDVLFVPRGGSHAVRSHDDVSLHLTLELQRWTNYDLGATLLHRVSGSPELRSALPVIEQPASGLPSEWITAMADQFRHFADTADHDDLRWTLYRDSHGDLFETPLAIVEQYELVRQLADEELQRRPELIFLLQDEPDAVVVRLRDRTIRLPRPLAPLVEAAMSGRPVRVADGVALGLSEAHARKTLATLLGEGILTRAGLPTPIGSSEVEPDGEEGSAW